MNRQDAKTELTATPRCPHSGKVRFRCKKTAKRCGSSLSRKHGHDFRPYRCVHCASWHLATVR